MGYLRNKRMLPRLILVVAATSFAVAGCAEKTKTSALLSASPTTRESASALTPAEKALRAKAEEKRKVEGAVTGATGGAVAGALVGALLGGWRGAAIGAVSGAVAGGVSGLAYGSYMNAKARKYSDAEARATAVSKGANETLVYFTQVNTASQQILAEQQAKVASLNEHYQSKAITKERYRKELASAGANEALMRDELKGINGQINDMKADPQVASLSRQIEALEQQRDSLKATHERLVELYATVPAEVRPATGNGDSQKKAAKASF